MFAARHYFALFLPLALAACTAPKTTADNNSKPTTTPAVTRAVDHSTPAGKLFDAGNFPEALKLSQQELAAVRAAANSTKQQKIAAITLVADTQSIIAKYQDADALYKEARALIDEKDEKSDDDQLNLAMLFHDIAKLRYFTADWSDAVKYAERAYTIRKKLLPADHPDLAESEATYGYLITGTPNDPRPETVVKSHALMIDAWKIRTKISDTSRESADSYSDLGLFFLTNEVEDTDIFPDAGDDEERTLKCLNKALDLRKQILGDSHPDVADSLTNLAYFNLQRQHHEEAVAGVQKAIALFEKSLGTNHPNVAYAYNLLGQIRERQGRYLEAIAHFEKAQKIYETTFGPNHYYIGTVLENLADLYSDMGDTTKVKTIQARLKRIKGIEI